MQGSQFHAETKRHVSQAANNGISAQLTRPAIPRVIDAAIIGVLEIIEIDQPAQQSPSVPRVGQSQLATFYLECPAVAERGERIDTSIETCAVEPNSMNGSS